jgi:hypothetical protein
MKIKIKTHVTQWGGWPTTYKAEGMEPPLMRELGAQPPPRDHPLVFAYQTKSINVTKRDIQWMCCRVWDPLLLPQPPVCPKPYQL